MFDTIFGLPVHALIVHATVVLTPLMCLLSVLVAVRKPLRVKYAWWVFAADVVVVALVKATQESGEKLEDRLGANPAIERHAHLGDQFIWFVLGLAIAALVVAYLSKREGSLPHVGTALVTVAAVLTLIWVVRIGHTGAEAVWSGLPSAKGS